MTAVPAQAEEAFYLRGDLGVVSVRDTNATNVNGNSSSALIALDYKNRAFWQVGAGYQFSELLRSDLTLSQMNLKGSGPQYVNGAASGFAATSTQKSTSLMLNGYLELAPVFKLQSSLKPFIGAGVGITNHRTNDATSTSGVVVLGDESNQFSWRIAAGTGYDLSDTISLNFEYAYMDMGKTRLSKTFVNSGLGNALTNPEADIRAQTFLIGLRYKL